MSSLARIGISVVSLLSRQLLWRFKSFGRLSMNLDSPSCLKGIVLKSSIPRRQKQRRPRRRRMLRVRILFVSVISFSLFVLQYELRSHDMCQLNLHFTNIHLFISALNQLQLTHRTQQRRHPHRLQQPAEIAPPFRFLDTLRGEVGI